MTSFGLTSTCTAGGSTASTARRRGVPRRPRGRRLLLTYTPAASRTGHPTRSSTCSSCPDAPTRRGRDSVLDKNERRVLVLRLTEACPTPQENPCPSKSSTRYMGCSAHPSAPGAEEAERLRVIPDASIKGSGDVSTASQPKRYGGSRPTRSTSTLGSRKIPAPPVRPAGVVGGRCAPLAGRPVRRRGPAGRVGPRTRHRPVVVVRPDQQGATDRGRLQ